MNTLSAQCSCKDLQLFMEAGTTVAASTVYVLSPHILAPAGIAGCPLSHHSPEDNTVDEPAYNPWPELAQSVCPNPSSPPRCPGVCLPSPPPLKTRDPGSFCPSTHFWSTHCSQPTTTEPSASSRADLPLAAMRATSAAATTSTTGSFCVGMAGADACTRAPRSEHGCLYRKGIGLSQQCWEKQRFDLRWEQLLCAPREITWVLSRH